MLLLSQDESTRAPPELVRQTNKSSSIIFLNSSSSFTGDVKIKTYVPSLSTVKDAFLTSPFFGMANTAKTLILC
jgi:hypothetical protein